MESMIKQQGSSGSRFLMLRSLSSYQLPPSSNLM